MGLSASFMGASIHGFAVLLIGITSTISLPASPFDLAISLGALASLQALVVVGIYARGRLRRISLLLSVAGALSGVWIAVALDADGLSAMTQLWIVGLTWAAIGQGLTEYSSARLRPI